MSNVPARQVLEDALKEFRKALVQQGVYAPDHQNLDRACSGAKDFVDFLLEGPSILRKGRVRKDARGRRSMDFVASRAQILRNVRVLDRLSRSSTQVERQCHHDRVRKGHSFVWTGRKGHRVFAPSRFVGYKNNNVARHERNHDKNG